MHLIIFDLDGTLIDSAFDIALSVNDVRNRLSLPPLPTERIESYIGDGVRKLLERALSDAGEDALSRAHSMYLPIYRRRLLDHTSPYEGVVPALDALSDAGCTLAVLTNKPRRESTMILEGLSLARYFDAVYGGDSFDHKKPHPVGIRHLIAQMETPAASTLFVGDSIVDFETARNASVRICLVTYGIECREASSLTPDFRVDDLRELEGLIT